MTRGAAVACLGNRKAHMHRHRRPSAWSGMSCFGVLPVRVQVKLYAPVGYNEAFGPFGSTSPSAWERTAIRARHWCPQCERKRIRIEKDPSQSSKPAFADLT